ncbi:MAG TPA: hypothetical protein VGP36_17905 [Mycobacteriales bacterium]|nr:hypothetical protein [Mycobacteriales bacterium]
MTAERMEAVMAASNAHLPEQTGDHLSLDELARRQGVHPIKSVAELVRYDVFESDEEVDEFIAFTYAQRRADIA